MRPVIASGVQPNANASVSQKAQNTNPRKISQPTTVLKRFAVRLETNNSLENRRFREINQKRVNDFIQKPFNEDQYQKLKFPENVKRQAIPGIFDYTTSSLISANEVPLNAPEFQRYHTLITRPSYSLFICSSLGPRSRFGEGDGSFWDKWINSDNVVAGGEFENEKIPLTR